MHTAPTHTATCRVCGAAFKPSPAGTTVNCPMHRGRVAKAAAAGRAITVCRCGKTVTHEGDRKIADCPRRCEETR